jgi:hypothetical protein
MSASTTFPSLTVARLRAIAGAIEHRYGVMASDLRAIAVTLATLERRNAELKAAVAASKPSATIIPWPMRPSIRPSTPPNAA